MKPDVWDVTYDADADEGRITAHGGSTIDFRIQFQHGPIGDNGINGVQNEEILDLLALRLNALDERFPCDENKIAIQHVGSAVEILRERTAKRRAQGVEGQNVAHVS